LAKKVKIKKKSFKKSKIKGRNPSNKDKNSKVKKLMKFAKSNKKRKKKSGFFKNLFR